MSEERAKALGMKPKAFIKAWTYVSSDPFEELLLGPTYATRKVLSLAGLTLKDIGVLEIHEAFAGQVLSNITAMGSAKFAAEKGWSTPVGEVDHSRLNLWGGSLALGHPFGATGARMVMTASNRMIAEGHKYALLTACADGGLAHACILERCE